MFSRVIFLIICVNTIAAQLTFRNVMVTCDSENPSDTDVPFGTIVTTNRLKPHLPNQKCFKISIQHATIPILYKDALSDIDNADFLLLENDEIEDIESGAFRNLKLKGALSLKSNKLTQIRRGIFNGVQVPVLFLSYNMISYIDYLAFNNMTSLESVHLDHNKLTRIDTFWFKNAPNLNKVNLQYNLIQEVPANAFYGKKSLSLDLSHNLISIIHENALARTKKISLLNLAFNRIQYLEKNWLKGVKVDVLDISNNEIRCLRYGLSGLYSTNFIDKNPWDCSCLAEIKKKEFVVFGKLEAEEWFQKCNLA